ncbi:cell envelope integrity protein TolA [Neorhizobium huautlense]|uniref:cell envelope integrity protein TolA n=1 Tax=Neorhizobium huautlense TaxID=67774 RepID=UPI000CF86935|nr:cell envelope integrity protein TolA [Neorhizobium huautlense]
MSLVVSQTGPGGRVGELALWAVAGLIMLTVHVGSAAYLLKEEPDAAADNSPPAAIMIELAPEPEAVKTEEEQISPDTRDQEIVESEQVEPVEEPQPEPEPTPEPTVEQAPEPVELPPQEIAEPVEPAPPEPVIEEPLPEPQPTPEVTETIPEPIPEPIEEIDPIEQQMTAALENVEVPLPMMRPEPPPAEKPEEAKKPEPKKEPVKKVEKPKRQQQQARQEMAEAKIQAKESDRTAASQTSTGSIAPSVSPAKWRSRVEARLARFVRRCPREEFGIAWVRFDFDANGSITSVRLTRPSGNESVDEYAVSAVRRVSSIPAPPAGVANSFDQQIQCLEK